MHMHLIQETIAAQRKFEIMTDLLTDADRSALIALSRAMKPFRDISQTSIPPSGIAAFCCVATRPGRTISDYARMNDVSLTAMSRSIADMSTGQNRNGGAGLGLIDTRPDFNDRRQIICTLSTKGAAFARQVASA